MKKAGIILFGIVLIVMSGCTFISKVKDVLQTTDSIGPGGCRGEECSTYCEKNQAECETWCEENPELCRKMLGTAGHERVPAGISPQECQQNPQKCLAFCEENPGVCPEEHLKNLRSGLSGLREIMSIIGPGGCRGPACQQYCQQKMEECQDWCTKNPDERFCKLLSGEEMPMGGFPGITEEAVEPPQTTITFAKTVNLNADQFTEQDIGRAKELGANAVTIWPARFMRNDEFTFSFPERLAPLISFAHKSGLQVELRSSFTGEFPVHYEKFRTNAIKHVADFAKFAEKSKVYRIVPFGEIDNNMVNQCDKITELAQELLAEMRKHYSGQIGVGIAGPWRDCGYSFKGYDYMTISAYAQAKTGTDAWLTTGPEINVHNVLSGARKVAERSGIKILHIGETGVINPDDTKREDYQSFATESKEKEAEFYQKFFAQVADKVNGLSVFYNSRMDYMSINGDPAEEVVKEWYTKLGPGIGSKEDTTKLIVANPLDLSQITRISKFRSCAGHDYSGLNIEGEQETLRSMKHYIEFFQKFLGSKNTVKVFAPFDGKITEIREANGKQPFISADIVPTWHFIFFHLSLEPGIKEGTAVKAGQLIGYAYVSEWPTFDFALKKFDVRGQIFESPFRHMQDSILEEYASYGITPENIIVSKQYRNAHPCPIKGMRDGEEAFTGETEKEDFVVLK